ncbi:hypothetical protein [Priestia flexa]|nr:hypothetical protein [Priestia flexa]
MEEHIEEDFIVSWSGELDVEKFYKVLLEVYDEHEKEKKELEKDSS